MAEMLVLKHFVPPILCIKYQKALYKSRKKEENFEKFLWFLGRIDSGYYIEFISRCKNHSLPTNGESDIRVSMESQYRHLLPSLVSDT